MNRTGFPVWLLVLDTLAVLAIGAGAVRLALPDMALVSAMTEPMAWAAIGAGVVLLAVFWVFFLRWLHLRRAVR